MPGLLSGSLLRSGGSGQFIKLANAQPQLPETPRHDTGFTVDTSDKLVTTYRSSLGNLEMSLGAVYSTAPGNSIKLIGTGTGTVIVLGGALSTSTNTGALQVIGGIATTQDIFVNGLTIGQGYQGANNLVIRGTASPVASDANDGQESIAIGYSVLEGIASSNNSLAIGYLALSSGTNLTGEVAIGQSSLQNLGNLTTWPVGSITAISSSSTAVVTVVGHGLTSGTVINILGLAQGPVSLNDTDFWINVITADTFALYSDDILSTAVDTTGLPAYVNGGTVGRVLFYDENTALGAFSGQNLLDGRQNFFLGPRAGQFLTTGSYNVIVGHDAAYNLISGSGNIIINGDYYVNGRDNQTSIGASYYYDGLNHISLTGNATVGLGLQSYGTTTGALVVAGGVGISKDLWVGGTIHGNLDGNSLASSLSGMSILANSATNVLVTNTTGTMTYYVAMVESRDGTYSPVDADAGVYYSGTNTSFTAPTFRTTGSVYSADGNPVLNGLLYTPRVLVGDFNVLTGITPNPGDFWIDILSQAQYQYINDGSQSYWLQIAIL